MKYTTNLDNILRGEVFFKAVKLQIKHKKELPIMQTNTKSKKSTYLIIAVVSALILGALIIAMSLGGFGSSASVGQVTVSQRGNTFTASSNHESPVERWKYAIRDDDTCNGSVFTDGGRQIGDNISISIDDNPGVYVIYGSNSFTSFDAYQITLDYKYICFNALLENGDWVQGGTQMVFTPLPVPDTDDTGGVWWDTECVDPDSSVGFGPIHDDAWCTEDDTRISRITADGDDDYVWYTYCADPDNPPPFGPIGNEWCTEDDSRIKFDPSNEAHLSAAGITDDVDPSGDEPLFFW